MARSANPANLVVEAIEPAYNGLDTDTAPDRIAPTKAPFIENFLVDRPGQLVLRGPINRVTSIFGGGGPKPIGVWVHNNNVLIGVKAVSATAVREPWAAPYRRAASAATLADAYTNAYHINLETSAVTPISPAVNQMPGARYARVGANTYGIAFDASTSSTQNGGVINETQLLRWDGTAVNPTAYTNAPKAAQDVKGHLQRLFVLGGEAPGTSTYQPNSLYWSDPGGPTADTLAMWQDDVSGLTNQLVVDVDDPSDFGVALGRASANLVIFKRRSIHQLLGNAPSNFIVKPFTIEQGCLDPRSVMEYEDGCFFMSDQGLMFFDGAQLINTTRNIRTMALSAALAHVGDGGDDGGFAAVGRLPGGYICLSIGVRPATVSDSTVDFCGLLHVASGNWTLLSSDCLAPTRPIYAGRALSHTFVMDDTKIIQADTITTPELADPFSRGIDVTDPVLTYDTSGNLFYTGTGNTLQNQQNGVQAYPALGSNIFPIHARWFSRLVQLSEPLRRSQLHRLMLDYSFNVAGALNDDTSSGWYLMLVDGQGNVVMPEIQVPSQAAVNDPSVPSAGVSKYIYRRQTTQDVFREANDVQLRVEWRSTPLPLQEASIFNSAVEFQPSSQRRSG